MNPPPSNIEHGPSPADEKSYNPLRRWPLRSFVICWGVFLIIVVSAYQYSTALIVYNNAIGRCESSNVWHEAQYRQAKALADNGVKPATRRESAEAVQEMEGTPGFTADGHTNCRAVIKEPAIIP